MLRKWNGRMQIFAVLTVGICCFGASSHGENIPISDADVNVGENPSRYARQSYGGGFQQRQMGLPGLGLFGINLFEKVATETATVLGSVNQQIGTAFNQLSKPYAAGQPGFNFGIGVNTGYPGYGQIPYGYGQLQPSYGYPAPPYGNLPQPQGHPPPYGQPPPQGGYQPNEQHHHGHDHGHGHGHGNGHNHGHGNGYASSYEHNLHHGNDHSYGGSYGHGNYGEYGHGHSHGQNAFRPPPNHQLNNQGINQGVIAPPSPPRIPGFPSTNTNDLNGFPIQSGRPSEAISTPQPPQPPVPAPPPPTVPVQQQPVQPAPPPPAPTTAAPTEVDTYSVATTPSPTPTPAPIPSTTTEDVENVSYDIDIRGEFESNQTRRRRQLIPNLFNSIGNIVQTGVNLANPANYQRPGQQTVFPIFGGFGQRPIFGQPSSQPQPGPSNGFQPQPQLEPSNGFQPQPQPPVAQPPPDPAPPTAGPSFQQSRPQPAPQPAPATIAPPPQTPPPTPETPKAEPQIPELNLQNIGGTDFTWTPENIGAHRTRRDTDAIFFPDDDIFERPLPIRPPTHLAINPVVKQPFTGSQAGAQSQSQNVIGGFEQSSGSQSQSQTVQNELGIFNQNAAGSTSGNIATDGSSGQLSAANTMQQSFQTGDSSGSKNAAQSQSANFDNQGNLALTSSNANTNSIREKDRFKEQSNAGSSLALQNQHGSSSSNAQTDSETFFENGIQGSKNTASSQSQQINKDGSVSGANANTFSNTFTGPNGLQGSSSSSQSSSFNQGQQAGGSGTSASATASSSSGTGTGGGAFSISGSFTGIPPFSVFPNLFNQLKGK